MKLRCGICALLALALVAGDALGQEGRRRGGGGGQPPGGRGMGLGMMPLTTLAKAKDIAADLKLSEEQVKKLDDLDKKMADKRREIFQSGDREGMREKMQELNTEMNKELTAIINTDQMKRLKQIQLQGMVKGGGVSAALNSEDVQKALSLNDEQKEQLRGFRQDMMEQTREMMQIEDRDERQKKMTEYRESMAKKMEKLLTDDQKAKLKELQGEPFKGEFPVPQMGRRKDG
jgi:hypothetical protein